MDFDLANLLHKNRKPLSFSAALLLLLASAWFWPAPTPDGEADSFTEDEDPAFTVSLLPSLEGMSEQELDAGLRSLAGERGLSGNPARGRSLPDIRTSPVAKLGRALFFSKSLSGNRDVACASCHHPLLAGGDGLSLSVGVDAIEPDHIGPGRLHDGNPQTDPEANGGPNVERNSPTTFNSALFNKVLFHDGRIEAFEVRKNKVRPHPNPKPGGEGEPIVTPDSLFRAPDQNAGQSLLQAQAKFPLVSLNEMQGFSSEFSGIHRQTWQALAERLKQDAQKQQDKHWLTLFQNAFGKASDPVEELITIDRITQAIAEYQKSQHFTNNPWRSWLEEKGSLSREARIGASLFFTSVEQGGAGCVACHSGDFYTNESFANLAVPQFGRGKSVHNRDLGRYAITRKREDLFAFRVPGLLNVSETKPYGHTGAFNTLESIINHHLDPRASIANYDFSLESLPQFKGLGVSFPEARQNTLEALEAMAETSGIPKFDLTEERKRNLTHYLTAFLNTLTDPCIKNSDCLQDWLPLEAPDDSHILYARIDRKFDNSQSRADASKVVHSTNFTSAVLPELYPLPETRQSCPKGNRPLSEGEQVFSFTDITRSSGIQVDRKYTSSVGLKFSLFDDHYTRFLNSGGIASGDINGDCLNDVVISMGPDSAPEVFLNTPEGRFKKPQNQWGLRNALGMAGAMLADLNGDGWLDLAAGSMTQNGEVHVYLNNRRDAFVPVAKTGIQASTPIGTGIGDVDNDGDMDLFLAEWSRIAGPEQEHLWLNNGQGLFQPGGRQFGLTGHIGERDYTFTPNFADLNNDGRADLILTSDFHMSQFFINDDGRQLSNHTDKRVINDENGMGSAIADFDNDGDLDWFLSSIYIDDPASIDTGDSAEVIPIGPTGNRFYRNDGTHDGYQKFTDTTEAAGVRNGNWGWGACAADFNNDGWQDIFHTTGYYFNAIDVSRVARQLGLSEEDYEQLMQMPTLSGFKQHLVENFGDTLPASYEMDDIKAFYEEVQGYQSTKKTFAQFGGQPPRLFMNSGDGTFKEQALQRGLTDTRQGRGLACFDYDRDGDIDILVVNSLGNVQFYRNNLSGDDQHYLSIKLQGTGANTQAIGARIYLTTASGTQMREVRIENNYVSHNPVESHFGLGRNREIIELTIVWPDGSKQYIKPPGVDQLMVIKQPETANP